MGLSALFYLVLLFAPLAFLNTVNAADSTEAQEWKTWAVALAILVPVAPYEIYAIFPINDRIDEIRLELEGKKAEDFSTAQKAELVELLTKWQWRNWGRVACPLVVGLVGLTSIARSV